MFPTIDKAYTLCYNNTIMQELKTFEVSQAALGGIYFGDDRTVKVCGANCVDREAITEELRAQGVPVRQTGCHGAIGGCAMSGTLESGTYATVPMQTDAGIVATEVIIRK